MAKEMNNPDSDFDDDFKILVRDEEAKVARKGKIQKALNGFEELIKDNVIAPETTFDGTLRAVRKKIREMRQIMTNAGEVVENRAKGGESDDFYKVAEEEKKRANQLLNYFEEAEQQLIWLQTSANFSHHRLTLKDVQRRLNNRLEEMEKVIDRDEVARRNRAE